MAHQPARNIIAIVGRPNVGKSSLFNRILGKRVAIVERVSGTTRDRLGQKTKWNDVPFELIDSGGIVPGIATALGRARGQGAGDGADLRSGRRAGPEADEELAKMVTLQVQIAISEASVILFVVDVSEGLTPLDMEIAQILRKAGKQKVILVVNKCDNPDRLQAASEFYALGFESMFEVSAAHGLGIGSLMDEAVAGLPEETPEDVHPPLRVAVVGQPNVGKSTFINFLLGEERLIVHDVPGTTRDSVDVSYEAEDGEKILFIDTAGIRRRRSMSRPIEKLSSLRAERSVGRCDIAILMLDAAKGPTTGDSRIAHIIREKQKSCVLVVNKWDLVKGVRRDAFAAAVFDKLPFLRYCPLLFTTATAGKGVKKALLSAREVHRESTVQIPTTTLNKLIQEALQHRPPPYTSSKGRATRPRRLKVYYATQIGVAPPKLRLFVNNASLAKRDYLSYLTNRIRDSFPFPGTPILLDLRERA
jgi:GTP-binding protein